MKIEALYIYKYTHITREQFEKNVPANWRDEIYGNHYKHGDFQVIIFK